MLDYHIHSKFCIHAYGEPEEYVRFALTQPLQEIGFAGHLPQVKWGRPRSSIRREELPAYVAEVLRLREKYKEIDIKLGIEADYFSPEEEDAIEELLAQYPFDYVYGSVHFIDGWPFNYQQYLDEWGKRDVYQVYQRYFELLRQSARSGLFDIISHPDLVKIYGFRPREDISDLIEETVQVFKETGVAVEINTSGLRRDAQEMYPSQQYIQLLKKYETPIVLGSDAHTPEDVGRDFDQAIDAATRAGYREIVSFQGRRIVDSYPLK